jgi:hypothetical protein
VGHTTCTSNDVVTGTSCNIGPSYNVGTGPSYNIGTGPSYNVGTDTSYHVGTSTRIRCNVGTSISTTCPNSPGCCHPCDTGIVAGTNQQPEPSRPPLCTTASATSCLAVHFVSTTSTTTFSINLCPLS